MHLDAEDLLARIRLDYPVEYELTVLREQVDKLTAENEQLRSDPAQPAIARPFVGSYPLAGEGGTTRV